VENGVEKKGIKVAILTVSTKGFFNERKDVSGDIIENICKNNNFEIIKRDIINDNKRKIKKILKYYADKLKVDLIITTGGTGFSPTDLTPEATEEIADKKIYSLHQLILNEILKKNKRAALSRGISAIRKKSLIINLPGSPKAVEEDLNVILDIIPHAIHIINGGGH